MQPMLSLALYRSGRRTGRWLSDLVAGFGQLGQSFYSLARHLHSADRSDAGGRWRLQVCWQSEWGA